MDELTLLREIGADTQEPDDLSLRRHRSTLLRQAGAETARPRRRAFLRVGVAAATVALLAGGVIVGETFWRSGESGRPAASANAAAVLERATKVTQEQADPVVGPDQYLKVSTKSRYLDGGDFGDGRSFATLVDRTSDLYVPGDRNQQWVLAHGPEVVSKVLFGEPPASQPLDDDEIRRAHDGAFYGAPMSPTAEFLASLPRDTDELRARVYADTKRQGPSPDSAALAYLADMLRTGLVPADLRAAFFEVMKTVPGVEVTDDTAVLDGRRGIAIGRAEPVNGGRKELVFDKATGLLIGEREVVVEELPDGLPVGTVAGFTAVTTTVVDEAP